LLTKRPISRAYFAPSARLLRTCAVVKLAVCFERFTNQLTHKVLPLQAVRDGRFGRYRPRLWIGLRRARRKHCESQPLFMLSETPMTTLLTTSLVEGKSQVSQKLENGDPPLPLKSENVDHLLVALGQLREGPLPLEPTTDPRPGPAHSQQADPRWRLTPEMIGGGALLFCLLTLFCHIIFR